MTNYDLQYGIYDGERTIFTNSFFRTKRTAISAGKRILRDTITKGHTFVQIPRVVHITTNKTFFL